jgi:hypothetical protein
VIMGRGAAGLAAGGPGQGIRSYAGMVRNST